VFAIVDIETTGGQPSANAITEIAVYISNGEKILQKFETLVNPEMPIPIYIQSFTGITQKMVETAPTFNQIAPELFHLLNGNIFVAHNVNFDYTFIKHQFELAGFQFQAPKLCTIRLSRKIIPGFSSYSLGNLCGSIGIQLNNRHRAAGDALATTQLFHLLVQKDNEQFIVESLKKKNKEYVLPPNLPKEEVEKLPQTPGIYYFIDNKGLAIYVGKAKNIKNRVISHFTGNLNSSQKQNLIRNTFGLSFVQTGNELLALLMESQEIKRLWPDENRAQKKFQSVFGLYDYLDQNGKIRFGVDKIRKELKPLVTFSNRSEALLFVENLIEEYGLCPKLCNHQTNQQTCTSVKNEICSGSCLANENIEHYNQKAQVFFNKLNADKKAFYIVGKGRSHKEQTVIVYEPGIFIGYCYINSKVQLDFDVLREEAQPMKINPNMEAILAPILNSISKEYKVYTQMRIPLI
jgi:DNA polymerase-3 subunit epsilon